MIEHMSLEDEHRFLKKVLARNLHVKGQIELSIRKKLEELKKLEILLEKTRLTDDKCEFVRDYL